MQDDARQVDDRRPPDLSLVLPCFDEEEVIERTVEDLFDAFARIERQLEIVAVDNGSEDRTGSILGALARRHDGLVPVRVEVNRGYGRGLLAGLPLARAGWVGILCADGQVAANDTATLFLAAERSSGPALFKVRRRFRRDGLSRKIVSVAYNVAMSAIFPGLGSIDVNGNPKILPRRVLDEMCLDSGDWFLDAEILIKARELRLRVHEVDVAGFPRAGGASSVRGSTCLEFVRNIARYRFTAAGKIDRAESAPEPNSRRESASER